MLGFAQKKRKASLSLFGSVYFYEDGPVRKATACRAASNVDTIGLVTEPIGQRDTATPIGQTSHARGPMCHKKQSEAMNCLRAILILPLVDISVIS